MADTKADLALDPVALMERSLHLWDPTGTFGLLQNQAYGYLFPMGPFSALLETVLPAWIVQRLWWGVLLTIGYLATRRLLAALAIGDAGTRHIAALAFALSPRVVSTIGPISSESAPALLAPAILLPVVLATQGRLSARRGAALSGVAVLACGGVNATATLVALVPAGLWMMTRSRWWTSPVTAWWAAAVGCATAWWVIPLATLGRYSPPFLDWIESADAVSRNISLLDSLRGTSHWLGHLVTTGGAWWNAGYQLVTSPTLIIATCLIAGLGLAGLVDRQLPERGFVLLLAVLGLTLLALPHAGVLASPIAGQVQALLDGALAPLRNVHKADPILRLALTLGLAHVLGRTRREYAMAGSRRKALGAVGLGLVSVALLVAASPGLAGGLASRGSFQRVPAAWADAGRWLDSHNALGTALVVPASNFGEYTWGRPMDEVLRTMTPTRVAVRDAVPLTPANTTRTLDSIESRLQSGRDIGGAVEVLRRSGVRYLVLRNDLDTSATGGVSVSVIRAALMSTPDLELVQGFGGAAVNTVGQRLRPVEIFAVANPLPEPRAQAWPLTTVTSASGAAESLSAMADAGELDGPVVFDGDVKSQDGLPLDSAKRVVTDGMRSRNRAFGAVRGHDVSETLTAAESKDAMDYLPWTDPSLRTTVSYEGVISVSATSALSDDPGASGLLPAFRPFAALDGDSTTAWVAYADKRPTLRMTFPGPRSVAGLEISGYADRDRFGNLLGVPTRLRLSADGFQRDVTIPATGAPGLIGLPPDKTSTLSITILDTDRGSRAQLTGFSSVRLPGLVVRETANVPSATDAAPDAYVFRAPDGAQDGCLMVSLRYRCTGDFREAEDVVSLDRTLPPHASPGNAYRASGTLTGRPGPGIEAFLDAGTGVQVTASSRRSRAPEARPAAVVDRDTSTAWSPSSTDHTPTLVLDYPQPLTVRTLSVHVWGEWLAKRKTTSVQVSVDGQKDIVPVAKDGSIRVRPMTGRRLIVQFLLESDDKSGSAALEISAVDVNGRGAAEPEQTVTAPCGLGPRLLVDGATIPTRVTGPRSAAYGTGQLTWTACAPVALSGPRGRVVLEAWGGFIPSQLQLVTDQQRSHVDSPGRSVTVDRDRAAGTDVRVGPGAASLLALTQNTNTGWTATLHGHRLQAVTVDGWRQGFIVPEGDGGVVAVSFGPDRIYRWGLLGGLLLVLALLLGALVPERRRRHGPALTAQQVSSPRWLGMAAGVGFGALLAGPWGAVVAVGAVATSALLRRRPALIAATVAGLVLVAGILQASVAPGALGPTWLEGGMRLACIAAAALVMSVGAFARVPSSLPVPRRTGR